MTRRFIDRARLARGHAPRLRYQLAIAWPDSDQAIGDIGLTLDSESQRAASLGYGLDPAVWGRGLMTEAVAAMADRAFGHFNVKRLWAVCDPDNRASARVLEKAGFSLEGRLRAHIRLRGVWRDSLLYARLDSDRARDTGSPGSGADIARDMGPGAHALRIRAGIAGGEDRQRGRRRGTSMA